MAIYKVQLEVETQVNNSPLILTTKREFHIEGGGDYLDDCFRMAKANGWKMTAIPIHTRTIQSIEQAFANSVRLDKEL